MQCLLAQRRLMLLATVLQHGSTQLSNLLTATHCGKRRPWVASVIQDFHNLQDFHPPKLDALGDPTIEAAEWCRCIVNYPHWWETVVSEFTLHTMALDVKDHSREALSVDRFKCGICNTNFMTKKALNAHMRARHGQRNPLQRYLGKTPRCPVCCSVFSSRTRLLAHVADHRTRGRRRLSCHAILTAGLVAPISCQELAEANEIDRDARKRARKRGHTQPLSLLPPKRQRHDLSFRESARQSLQHGNAPSCSNALDWQSLRPTKRLRAKTSADAILEQLCFDRKL